MQLFVLLSTTVFASFTLAATIESPLLTMWGSADCSTTPVQFFPEDLEFADCNSLLFGDATIVAYTSNLFVGDMPAIPTHFLVQSWVREMALAFLYPRSRFQMGDRKTKFVKLQNRRSVKYVRRSDVSLTKSGVAAFLRLRHVSDGALSQTHINRPIKSAMHL
ncbi:hypothetical protein K439DRAFT_1568605 [Ramaria rubella]|nr:hypothetical protein K439DRAFT_1568605 [Ramaria rubella]